MSAILTSNTQAALINVGIADYDYFGDDSYIIKDINLMWDNNENLIWLDYATGSTTWYSGVDWANGLNSKLTTKSHSGYRIDWGILGAWSMASKQELVVLSQEDLNNSFSHPYVTRHWFWANTETSSPTLAHVMRLSPPSSGYNRKRNTGYSTLAARSATVEVIPVPEPPTIAIFSLALFGLLARKRAIIKNGILTIR